MARPRDTGAMRPTAMGADHRRIRVGGQLEAHTTRPELLVSIDQAGSGRIVWGASRNEAPQSGMITLCPLRPWPSSLSIE